MKYYSLLFIFLAVLFFSCDDEDGSSGVGVQFVGQSDNIELKSATVDNSVVSIAQARIGIVELELEAEYEEESGEYEREIEWEIEISGPFKVDLLTGIATPEIILMDIEPGMDYEFECEVSDVLDDGKSAYISGEADVNGDVKTFIFETNEDFSIEIEGRKGLGQSSNVNDLWTVIVDFDYLFRGVSFQNAQIGEDDVIVINRSSNKNLYDILVDRLESSFEFED